MNINVGATKYASDEGRKRCFLNYILNTFYYGYIGVGDMVKDHKETDRKPAVATPQATIF